MRTTRFYEVIRLVKKEYYKILVKNNPTSLITFSSIYQGYLQTLDEKEHQCLEHLRKDMGIEQYIVTEDSNLAWNESAKPRFTLINDYDKKKAHVHKMKFIGIGLSQIPSCLKHFTHLEEIDLSNNHIETIPEWLNALPFLKQLNLDNNNIKILPEWLKEASHLKHLRVEGNPLSQKEIKKWLDWQGIDTSIKAEKIFTINEHLSLKLIEGQTFIFIDDNPLIISKFLVTHPHPNTRQEIPENIDDLKIEYQEVFNYLYGPKGDEFKKLSDLEKIAHVIRKGGLELITQYQPGKLMTIDRILSLRKSIQIKKWMLADWESSEHHIVKISPETIFWGHCSNLQAWAEHEYDMKLLHHSLGYPILKRLAQTDDKLARKRLKEAIKQKLYTYKYSYKSPLWFIREHRYLNKFFSKKELNELISGLDLNKCVNLKEFMNIFNYIIPNKEITITLLRKVSEVETDLANVIEWKRDLIRYFYQKEPYVLEDFVKQEVLNTFDEIIDHEDLHNHLWVFYNAIELVFNETTIYKRLFLSLNRSNYSEPIREIKKKLLDEQALKEDESLVHDEITRCIKEFKKLNEKHSKRQSSSSPPISMPEYFENFSIYVSDLFMRYGYKINQWATYYLLDCKNDKRYFAQLSNFHRRDLHPAVKLDYEGGILFYFDMLSHDISWPFGSCPDYSASTDLGPKRVRSAVERLLKTIDQQNFKDAQVRDMIALLEKNRWKVITYKPYTIQDNTLFVD